MNATSHTKTLAGEQNASANPTVKITPTLKLAGQLKAMRCDSGCYLLEELGDKAEARRLTGERLMPVSLAPIKITLGFRGISAHPNDKLATDTPTINTADSLGVRALFELGFRKKIARAHGCDPTWIEKLELEEAR